MWRAIELVAVFVTLIAFWVDLEERSEDRINNAWQLLYLSAGKGGEGMRDSIEFLSKQDRSFQGMDFEGCFLESADLSGADLRKANFYDANLFGVNFTDAQINGADFRSAVLTEAKGFEGIDFNILGGWDEETVWPDGVFPPSISRTSEESAGSNLTSASAL